MAKIGDVGMAKIMSDGYLTRDGALGTMAWAAPELLLGEKCVSFAKLGRSSMQRVTDAALLLSVFGRLPPRLRLVQCPCSLVL